MASSASATETSFAAVAKPPYIVPLMSVIRKTKWNGLRAASTFSGGGGSSLGYKMAGFQVVWASEFVEAARDTYAANFPDTVLDGRDIREVRGSDILQATGLKVGELDVFDGSPPCASFSTAGKREKGWGTVKKYSDVEQRSDDLFFEYARLLGELKPRAFVAENVSGLVKGTAKGYFKEILKALEGQGYRVRARLLDAQWLGVPQKRQRLIFIGYREDLGLEPDHPSPLSYRYSIREALTGLKVPVEDKAAVSIERFAIGKEWKNLGEGETSERYFNLVRPMGREPAPTVTATSGSIGAASIIHYEEARKFTASEMRRICSFPDDFQLLGDYSQQVERLGRAVPPVMMCAIARAVAAKLK